MLDFVEGKKYPEKILYAYRYCVGRRLPQNKEFRLKNVDKIIAEVMKLENYKNREEVFAQYPKLAQWWAQEYSMYGEGQEEIKTTTGGHDR